ncbi:type IV toxin-antitoxin system AbiEi family antitoxin domain-containing protein [Arthrobacter sp. OV608]|uniref:type IV toxin-antitoxin system AbiEi family antitoxin domain-containing protein n=1 Tax=Arthrobacter sp. OV608 TaxID=1882768 RepID=UPI0008D6F43D|nr:type IV toxin-antitoxin system AbiEi family antitoxin domain-containing protein [Arthrobacter sp. OV608]SEQ94422.1 Very-short-patch-repair endonuclease [Arthrobacter sp. OV608]
MDLMEILTSAGGVLLRRDVLAAGATDTELRRAVRSGQILRLERGLLAVADADPELVAAGRAHGLVTCASAARAYGLWQLSPPVRPHYWQSNGRSAIRCVSHRTDLTQPPRHRTLVALPDVLLHALLCLPELESLVMVECAYNRGDIELSYLLRHLDGRRCGKARNVVSKVDRGADSLLETLARVLFRDAGILTKTQVWIDGIGRVDFLLEGFLIVEIDGLAFHLEARQFKKDRRRDNSATLQGLPVLRFFYDDVVHAPESVLVQVREVLARGSSRWPQPNRPGYSRNWQENGW